MYNISYPNFNNNSFCYNNQVMQNSKCKNKNQQRSFGENAQTVTSKVPVSNQKTVYVPTTPNGNGSGVNIIIYNPAVVPGSNTTFNNHYAQSPTLNTTTEGQSNQTQLPSIENEFQNNENIYDNFNDNENINPEKSREQENFEETQNNNNELNLPSYDNEKEEEKKVETKEVTLLTDEYIKTLENYLRNDNRDIRTQGIEMLAKCFREDKTRYDDVALNNLLNLALQDVEPRNRILTMCLLDTKDAKGDDLTYDILTQLQKSTAYGGEEAKMASKVLLEMNTRKVQVTQNEQAIQNEVDNNGK